MFIPENSKNVAKFKKVIEKNVKCGINFIHVKYGENAKETRNTIAFGSAFPGVDCRIHNSDEFILLEHFRKSMAIYAHAIMALGIEI